MWSIYARRIFAFRFFQIWIIDERLLFGEFGHGYNEVIERERESQSGIVRTTNILKFHFIDLFVVFIEEKLQWNEEHI